MEIGVEIGGAAEMAEKHESKEEDDSRPETWAKADVREDISSDAPAWALAGAPPGLSANLKQAIITGSPDRIADVLETIRMNDPALADALKKLVDGFEYEKILTLIQEGDKGKVIYSELK